MKETKIKLLYWGCAVKSAREKGGTANFSKFNQNVKCLCKHHHRLLMSICAQCKPELLGKVTRTVRRPVFFVDTLQHFIIQVL